MSVAGGLIARNRSRFDGFPEPLLESYEGSLRALDDLVADGVTLHLPKRRRDLQERPARRRRGVHRRIEGV